MPLRKQQEHSSQQVPAAAAIVLLRAARDVFLLLPSSVENFEGALGYGGNLVFL